MPDGFRICARLVASAVLIAPVLFGPNSVARAQSQPPPMPPHVAMRDENGVDMMSGSVNFEIPSVSIGSGEFAISVVNDYVGKSPFLSSLPPDSMAAGIFASGTSNIAQLGLDKQNINSYTTYSGGKVVYNDNGTATYTLRNGASVYVDVGGSPNGLTGRATKVVWPNGKTWRYTYGSNGSLASVSQNNGLQIRYQQGSVAAVNSAIEYCDPSSTSCSFSQVWASGSWSYTGGGGVDTFVNSSGQVTSVQRNLDNNVIEVKFPVSGGGATIVFDRCNSSLLGPYKCYWATSDGGIGGTRVYPLYDKVISSTRRGTTWNFNYNWNIGCCYAQYQRSGVNGSRTLFFYSAYNQSWPIWLDDGYGRYNFSNNEASRIISHVRNEGNREDFTYDSRGNVTLVTYTAKPGSGLPDQTVAADYDAACINYVTCNKPNWVIDRKGNRTDFQYSSVHGQVTREVWPTVNGVQPVIRYYYTQRSAWYLGSGGYVRDPDGIWLLTSKKICRTGATNGDTCAVGNDEVATLYDYGPDSGPNNLWLRGEAVQADGVTLWTCYGYDRFGNRISVTKPKAGQTSCS